MAGGWRASKVPKTSCVGQGVEADKKKRGKTHGGLSVAKDAHKTLFFKGL
jgi:hypothetical protein